LDAAADLLATNPSASLAEIAAHARIGKATLHRYFESHEALVLALALRSLAAIQQAIAASRPAEGPLDQALLRLAEALVPLGDKLYFLLSAPMQPGAGSPLPFASPTNSASICGSFIHTLMRTCVRSYGSITLLTTVWQ
jgi:AcrR family transcriptional regulator